MSKQSVVRVFGIALVVITSLLGNALVHGLSNTSHSTSGESEPLVGQASHASLRKVTPPATLSNSDHHDDHYDHHHQHHKYHADGHDHHHQVHHEHEKCDALVLYKTKTVHVPYPVVKHVVKHVPVYVRVPVLVKVPVKEESYIETHHHYEVDDKSHHHKDHEHHHHDKPHHYHDDQPVLEQAEPQSNQIPYGTLISAKQSNNGKPGLANQITLLPQDRTKPDGPNNLDKSSGGYF